MTEGQSEAVAAGDEGLLHFLLLAFTTVNRRLEVIRRANWLLHRLAPVCAEHAAMVAEAVQAIDVIVAHVTSASTSASTTTSASASHSTAVA